MVDKIYLMWYIITFFTLAIIAIVYVKNGDDSE